jgi:hypothetical protein
MKSPDQKSMFPEGYKYPDFYYEAMNIIGAHSLELIAEDTDGLITSKQVTFVVINSLQLTKPGWYNCNSNTNPPCDQFQQHYCDKFNPTDLAVRQAASQAITKHPGAFSLNQLLDIYDWVRANIFYQNVPINIWSPYSPNETLRTKSGDCKNQAVLIASMVEAIGGSARILYIPDCKHAFAEVYVGNNEDVNALNDAVWSHYQMNDEDYKIHWHTSKNANGETENWFIFDTAGGQIPGQTIEDCFNASQTFELRDCTQTSLNAPEIQGTEYGPYIIVDDSQVIEPRWGYHYWTDQSKIPNTYKWCHYKVNVESKSKPTLNWYVTDENNYYAFDRHESFNYYYGEEQVQKGGYEFDWTTSEKFYVILVNGNDDYSMTTKTQITETCYKG